MTRSQLIARSTACAVAVAVALGAAPAWAASPSPRSSCTGQLSQGGTPNGLSQSEPGAVGSFVSALAQTGTNGAVTSTLAGQHGDLFTCILAVPPLG